MTYELLRTPGSSPRMRGAHLHNELRATRVRIIPAYAGSTTAFLASTPKSRDHPRVCGEHARRAMLHASRRGSSPRMRGARSSATGKRLDHGIIPAYAGSTFVGVVEMLMQVDHPRVCGEHLLVPFFLQPAEGSSPRMRGARKRLHLEGRLRGIIPAYAGSTLSPLCGGYRARDHPRVCGEHLTTQRRRVVYTGSSPRMRGAPRRPMRSDWGSGIIPAYAGSTEGCCRHGIGGEDHPRVCGEHPTSYTWGRLPPGSSPRMRGAHLTKCIASVIELVLHTVVKVQLTAHCYRFSYLQPYPQLRS